jgi:hypothetical protein
MSVNAKELIAKLIDRYERTYFENCALKALLSTLGDPLAKTWEENMNQLLADRNFCEELHARTAELRASISAALDR